MFERRRPTKSSTSSAQRQPTWTPSPSPSPPLSASPQPDPPTLSDADRLRLLQTHPALRPSDMSSTSQTGTPLVVLSPKELERIVQEEEQGKIEEIELDESGEVELWEELANALLWTIPFGFLFAGMDYAVHAQYGQTLVWRDELSRLGNVVPTIYVLTFLVSRPKPIASPLVIQAILTALCTAFGVSLVNVTLKDSYTNVMSRAPSLGTLWVWTVVRLDLLWALVGLASVAGVVWYNGQTDAFKVR
ncbi:hypothetical protein ACM66B_005624 [Microbotryomycetes sp. NB124-2]